MSPEQVRRTPRGLPVRSLCLRPARVRDDVRIQPVRGRDGDRDHRADSRNRSAAVVGAALDRSSPARPHRRRSACASGPRSGTARRWSWSPTSSVFKRDLPALRDRNAPARPSRRSRSRSRRRIAGAVVVGIPSGRRLGGLRADDLSSVACAGVVAGAVGHAVFLHGAGGRRDVGHRAPAPALHRPRLPGRADAAARARPAVDPRRAMPVFPWPCCSPASGFGDTHPEVATLFVAVSIAAAVASFIIEPATTRAAFGDPAATMTSTYGTSAFRWTCQASRSG